MSLHRIIALVKLLVVCALLLFPCRFGAAQQSVGRTPRSSIPEISPRSSDAIQYVSPHGNDSNDGLSWGAAKLTVFAACEALPGGATSPSTCGNGTIYFSDQSSATPVANGGLWLMGALDPN